MDDMGVSFLVSENVAISIVACLAIVLFINGLLKIIAIILKRGE